MLPWEDDDGVQYRPSKLQQWINSKRDKCLYIIKMHARTHKICLMRGGDSIQGDNKKSGQFVGTTEQQCWGAIDWNMPFVNLADRNEALIGTEFHVGLNGKSDRFIAKELGARIYNYRRLEVGGRIIDWAHKCQMGNLDWTECNSFLRVAKEMEYRCLRNKQPLPDLMMSHHVHRARCVVAPNGITVATGACWQLPTMNLYQSNPRSVYPDIGMVLYWTRENRIEPITWTPAMPRIEGNR
jgi:hypothetical protein